MDGGNLAPPFTLYTPNNCSICGILSRARLPPSTVGDLGSRVPFLGVPMVRVLACCDLCVWPTHFRKLPCMLCKLFVFV